VLLLKETNGKKEALLAGELGSLYWSSKIFFGGFFV
jgi:hypothetical protein